jgi:hypothetical protein
MFAFIAGRVTAVCVFLLCSAAGFGQKILQRSLPGPVALPPGQEALLVSEDERRDMECSIEWLKPTLGFDLVFHSGYRLRVPLRSLAGRDNILNILFRVSPGERNSTPVYFHDRIRVPTMDENAAGDVVLHGVFDLGLGNYRVDWLVHDRAERVCSAHAELTAALPKKDRLPSLVALPGQILEAQSYIRELPLLNPQIIAGPLRISVVINFVGVDTEVGQVHTSDVGALIGILRMIVAEPAVGAISITAVDVVRREVLYRQRDSRQIDFARVIQGLTPARTMTVDIRDLEPGNGLRDFLGQTIADEIHESQPNAVILISPRVSDVGGGLRPTFTRSDQSTCSIFYMALDVESANISPDPIAAAVKRSKGVEYAIRYPADLIRAWADVTRRMQ